uniref:Sodefrin-like factor n=1 Tax=Pinctada fucata TaxID=50426 RepID=A0A194ANC3_PINFU
MGHLAIAVLFVILGFTYVYGATKECASCEEAPSIEECRLKTTICGDNEECFLEKVTTDQLNIAYNAGCRSHTICIVMNSLKVGKRSVVEEDFNERGKRKTLVNCAECCETAKDDKLGPCNVRLCGLQPNASKPVCLVCSGYHSGPNFCTTKDTCQDTQVCHTGVVYINGGIRFTYGCEDRHRCEAFINHKNKTDSVSSGKRQDVGVHLCDACCTGNECNKEDCFALYKKMSLASIGVGNTNNPPASVQPSVAPSTGP